MNQYLADPALSYWPADVGSPLLEMTTGEALRTTAQSHPQRTALVEVMPVGMKSLTGATETARRWTYAQLLTQAEQCAHWLLARFAPGERVCLWAPNIPEWVIVQYGAALAGLVLVTANPALRAGELRYVLRQSRAAGLLHVAEFRGADMGAIAQEVADEVRQTFCLSRWHEEVLMHEGRAALPQVLPRDAAQIQYTSGTTGHPKGALLHHMGLVNDARLTCDCAGIGGSVVLSPMPLFHTAGSVLSSLGCVTTASTFVLPLMFEPEMAMAAIERERCDVLFGVPTMQIAMLEHPARTRYDLTSLRVAISGGAPVPPELLRRIEAAFRCDLLTLYGQTECSPTITIVRPEDAFEDKSATVGRPLPQVEVRVAEPVTGQTVAVGTEGEIEARGYQCMLAYFDLPVATAEAVRPDGWLRTGDLGTMDSRGFLRVTGRLKDMIIRGGENVYPAEIEACLMAHPSVVQAAVFGVPDPKWGEVVAAAVLLRPEAGPNPAVALAEHCGAALARHKVPNSWFSSSNFPLTASGKVQKFRLKEMVQSGELVPLPANGRHAEVS